MMRKSIRGYIGSVVLLALFLLISTAGVFAQGRGGGGGNRGGGTVGPNPLPTTPPAPDVLIRESFGFAELLRPTGGKGALKDVFAHKPIQSFWVEYPGSKNTQWLAPAEGQTWRYAGCSDNPYEMYSPIQMTLGFYMNGCVASEWFEIPTVNPTALMPFRAPANAYEVSINGYPAPIEGKYFALGLTNSSVVYSNLETSASVWLVLRANPATSNFSLLYELRLNGMTGTVLASGETSNFGFNQLALRYDPVAKTINANVNGTDLGTFPLNMAAPKYVGFEGVGIADNFVVRTLQ